MAGSAVVGLLFAHAQAIWHGIAKWGSDGSDGRAQIQEGEGFEMAPSGDGAGASGRARGG